MQNSQLELCCEVLRRFEREGLLDDLILIGSWCLLAYRDLFDRSSYWPAIRTRDVDFLVPLPLRVDHTVNMVELLDDLDFVASYRGREGYMQLVHEDLMVEFIVPERGRGSDKPFPLPELGVNAQRLRFMDFLADHSLPLSVEGIKVRVPHPAGFALLKLVISARRSKPVKRENDRRQAVLVLRALLASGYKDELREIFNGMPGTWQKTVLKELKELPLVEDVITLLRDRKV